MIDIFDEIKARVSMPEVVKYYGFTPNSSGKILCPFHSEKTPSCKINEQSFKCFGCDIGGDIFDFVEKMENCNRSESLKIVKERFNCNIDNNYKPVAIPEKKEKPEINQSEFIKNAAQNIENTTYYRGISLETLKRFKVGYCAQWHNSPNAPTSPRLIIPTSKYSYVARDTRDNLTEMQKRYAKQKVGKIRPLIAIRNELEPIFIVEGEIDALSVYDAGGNAIGLGGTSGINKLPLWLKKNNIKSTLILALDNDNAGKKATQSLKLHLDKENIAYIESNIYGNCKDANEALNTNRTDFELAIKSAVSDAARLSKKEQNKSVICLADIEASEVEWLWKPYIPKGKITLLSADPGTGKTFFCLYLASVISKGGNFFNEPFAMHRQAGKVIYQTAEDGISDTILPRLKPMQPNLNNILIINETKKQLSFEDKIIEETMQKYNPDLMIFDPLQAYLGAKVDMHRANEVRPILSKIEKLAEKYSCAVILIMHLSKQSQSSALYRGLGSMDIPAIARSMLVMGKHPEDANKRVICHEKSSLAMSGKSIAFSINMNSSGIIYEGECDYTANEILNASPRTRKKPSVKLDDAASALNELIGENGCCTREQAETLRTSLGFSSSTLRNARELLGLKTVKIGFGNNLKSYWYAPEDYENKTEEEIKEVIKEICQ